MKVILISGKAQSGKDTVGSMLYENLISKGQKVLLTHYADLLKYICHSYLGWDGNKDKKGRQMLQYVGTDIIRAQNPTFWVDFVVAILKYFYNNWDYVIIPDCRFPDEITTMTKNGFDTIHLRILRPSFGSDLTPEQLKHPSEIALDDTTPDFYIHNSGTINDLGNIISLWIKENLHES